MRKAVSVLVAAAAVLAATACGTAPKTAVPATTAAATEVSAEASAEVTAETPCLLWNWMRLQNLRLNGRINSAIRTRNKILRPYGGGWQRIKNQIRFRLIWELRRLIYYC